MSEHSRLLQVFLKAPEPGKVKTRLIPDLGETLATDIHKRLVSHVLKVLDRLQIEDQLKVETECWVAGDLTHPFVQDLAQRYELFEQQGLDLGERMYNALLHGLQRHQQVVLVGADAFSLMPAYITQAFQTLEHKDVVLGPAHDGGYMLVGLNKLHPEMFADIDWGTDSVLMEQQENLNRCQLAYELLPEGFDIDDISDIRRFAPELLEL